MRQLASSRRLASLPLHSRLVYSSFLVMTLAGLGLAAGLGVDIAGRLGAHYRGEVITENAGSTEGPSLDLPELEPAPAMSSRQLLETAHFHVFAMSIHFLVLSHLFALSGASSRAKAAWIIIALVSTIAHLIAPWTAARGSAGSSVLFAVSGALFGVSYAVLCVRPLWDMWSSTVRPEAFK